MTEPRVLAELVQRLSRLMEGPLGGDSDIGSCFLLTNAVATNWTKLLSYHEIRDLPGFPLNPMHASDTQRHTTAFVSHKWGPDGNPDPDGRVLQYLKENPNEFCFVDYCCTNQINPSPFEIAAALEWSFSNREKLKFIKITASDTDYQRSTWCNFESVLLQGLHLSSVPSPLRIANPTDVEFMMISAHQVWGELSDETKKSIFFIIVAMFDGLIPGWRNAKHPMRQNGGPSFCWGVGRIRNTLGEEPLY